MMKKRLSKGFFTKLFEQIGTDKNKSDGFEDASTYFQECSMPEGEIPNDDNEVANGQTMEQLFNHPTESSQTEPSLTNCLSDF
jgi:hypothetical protein